ncbi:MBL fold metallo-hydrolase [Pelagibacterium halotolerans]|uniref:Putative metal-dependent hydrolase n=1 Tax=Pelagibacterium halotolerans (strain DSM 22347 / JCM 15775 / CGMCC 1.7692 / B2) TaxID=1082931 RepID=G4RGZ5_PELHB|nr:MBL fold metallo-hydrolase [Pelagibacterium halotolerans]AEQ53148.1 putative metal-dependent hydrolase [Pelagibacterium halotolerans B2]QJR17208.1 MBL fold metallo-hydrolase [Pelagibacterium halotolerans]SEA89023.1 L-ascorbate metabolism protein UlaG, beta-lactamase superfamily [Pelagibacterium halotolerans]
MTQRDTYETAKGPLAITPIHHATFVMEWAGETIYCDPVGDTARFAGFPAPTLVILTHHHGDHLDLETLNAVLGDDTEIIAPKIVYDQLPENLIARTTQMANGELTRWHDIPIRAVAMYNTTPDRQKYHEKGVGNGYLFDFAGTTVYLASDTEPTPEMDDLGRIDIAFFPMNLPYTMTPDQVVTCIAKTAPRYVYPFHYRFPFDKPGNEPSDLTALLAEGSKTEIVERDWY